MTSKRELQVAYGMAIILFVAGVLSYAAFSHATPEQPLRQMFKTSAGKVLFDHKEHLAESGYALDCVDCHHNLEDDEEGDLNCGECHEPGPGDEDLPGRADAFHQQCIGCHEDANAGPKGCNECHVL